MSSIEDAVQDKLYGLYGGFTWLSRVISKIDRRACEGESDYGYTLDRDDLSYADWLEHAEDEMLDAINYLQKIKSMTSDPLRARWLEKLQRQQIDVLYMFEIEFSRELIANGK